MIQGNAAENAANAQQDAADAAIAEQRRQFDALQANQQPYMQFGQSQLGALAKLMGGDYSGFDNSPDYKFALEQGFKDLNRFGAAHGSYYSGGMDEDRLKLGQGLATQNLNNYRGALQWGANLGQNAAAGVGQAGMQSAGQIGQYLTNNGNNQAQSYLNQGNNTAGAVGALGSAFNDWWGTRDTSQNGGWYLGNNPGRG